MKRLGYSLLYLASVHIIALVIFFIFRISLFFSIGYEFPLEIGFTTKSIAFIKGLWFDNVIACYIMVLPLVIVCIASLFKKIPKAIFNTCTIILGVLFSVTFLISAANIPYFDYFFNNINSSIFNWMGYGTTTGGMIFEEASYYIPIIGFIIIVVLFWFVLIKITNKFYFITTQLFPPKGLKDYAFVTLIIIGCISLCIFGIRGRTGYNPIKVSQAYYCQDPFLNQLGINPTFNLLTSTLDDMRKENKPIELIPDNVAIKNTQTLLNRQGIDNISPIARKIETNDSILNRKNIVLILMESMSAHLMKSFGQEKELTPYLDSLYNTSLSFKNFYSSGLHTNHGIYATLYSFPTIMKRNAMKGTTIPVYSGLPTVLAENGYHNMFFMTHESQYDNMNGFFHTNGFHEIYAEENYPTEKRVNSFGVQDDFLFSYALPIISERANTGKPFFTVLLTISNHPPYIVPPHFAPKNKELQDQIVEFADWSINEFMNKAKEESWYDNTIFVFLGDHGKLVGTPECEMPQSYNHVPLIIHGKDITPEIRNDFAGQIDVAPTILGMLGFNYTQNNFGIDLNKEKRPYAFYTTDKHIAARDSSRLYIYEPSEKLEFFYTLSNSGMIEAECDSTFKEMKNYCFSMLQSAQFLAKNKLTLDKEEEKASK